MFEQLAMVDLQIGEKLKDVVLKREGAVAAFSDALTQVFQRPRPGLIVLRKATESWLPALEQSGNFELAGKLCEMLAAAYQNHTNPEVRKLVQQRTDMTRRRLSLLGQPLSVEGKLLDGSPLDYTPYQGKAVLVVFWASFSPVSRPALLAIKPLYEKYHAQGLEVIGVCLDEELTAANRLINELQLPWTTITNSKWAQQLGIEMIPYLLLADQQGKVVDLYMATSDLDAKLAGLLGVAPPATTQPPVNELREPAAAAK
jgi:thiol-disulfide isomerase/thioredoxin